MPGPRTLHANPDLAFIHRVSLTQEASGFLLYMMAKKEMLPKRFGPCTGTIKKDSDSTSSANLYSGKRYGVADPDVPVAAGEVDSSSSGGVTGPSWKPKIPSALGEFWSAPSAQRSQEAAVQQLGKESLASPFNTLFSKCSVPSLAALAFTIALHLRRSRAEVPIVTSGPFHRERVPAIADTTAYSQLAYKSLRCTRSRIIHLRFVLVAPAGPPTQKTIPQSSFCRVCYRQLFVLCLQVVRRFPLRERYWRSTLLTRIFASVF